MKASEFKRILMVNFESFADLMVSKNLDYGPAAIGDSGFPGILTRTGDKLGRLKGLTAHGKNFESTENHESILDTCMDLSNYGMIAWLYWQGMWPKEQLIDDRNVVQVLPPTSLKSDWSVDPRVAVLFGFPLVYLAGPIDAHKETGIPMILSQALAREAVLTFSPAYPFHGPEDKTGWGVVRVINEGAIRASSAMIANLPKDVSTVGTVIEIQDALALGKPVVVISPVKYVYFGDKVIYADTPEDAVQKVLTCLRKTTQ